MEKKNMQKHHELVQFLSNMPGKIVGLHGLENITEFVLHDLSVNIVLLFRKWAIL